MEIRTRAIAAGAGLGAGALLIRAFPPDRYPIYPVCPVRALTGWQCPGCGSTHAAAALLAGRWAEAWHANPLAMALGPVVAVMAGIELYSALRWNRWQPIPLPPVAGKAILTAALLFGLLRNIAS